MRSSWYYVGLERTPGTDAVDMPNCPESTPFYFCSTNKPGGSILGIRTPSYVVIVVIGCV